MPCKPWTAHGLTAYEAMAIFIKTEELRAQVWMDGCMHVHVEGAQVEEMHAQLKGPRIPACAHACMHTCMPPPVPVPVQVKGRGTKANYVFPRGMPQAGWSIDIKSRGIGLNTDLCSKQAVSKYVSK